MLFLTVLSLYLVGASAFILPPLPNSGRIFGGVETSIEERPYSVSLQRIISESLVGHLCGASILSANYLLSAAHCLTPDIHARVGSSDYSKCGQLIKVTAFVQHPEYYKPTLQYDFAVLTLEESIVFGPLVAPVVLPTSSVDDPKENEITTVSGWGWTNFTILKAPQIIHKVDLPAWDNARCKSVYSYLTPRQICLGGTPQGGTSACIGDSGGPVTFNGIQVALVSGGDSCSAPNIPGKYARVSSVLDWIKQEANMQNCF